MASKFTTGVDLCYPPGTVGARWEEEARKKANARIQQEEKERAAAAAAAEEEAAKEAAFEKEAERRAQKRMAEANLEREKKEKEDAEKKAKAAEEAKALEEEAIDEEADRIYFRLENERRMKEGKLPWTHDEEVAFIAKEKKRRVSPEGDGMFYELQTLVADYCSPAVFCDSGGEQGKEEEDRSSYG